MEIGDLRWKKASGHQSHGSLEHPPFSSRGFSTVAFDYHKFTKKLDIKSMFPVFIINSIQKPQKW